MNFLAQCSKLKAQSKPRQKGQGFDLGLNEELMLSISTIPSINAWAF